MRPWSALQHGYVASQVSLQYEVASDQDECEKVNVRIFHRILALGLLMFSYTGHAQDLEPRRWAHLPTGLNFFGAGLFYIEGDIFLDPVLRIEDVEFERVGLGLGYIRSFGLFGKSARFDVSVPYASGRWEGLVDDQYTSIRRRGFGDPRLRLSVLLYGAPAQTPQEYAQSEKSNTIVGTAIALTLPTGDYLESKLMNLGDNRLIVRPQVGVTHTRRKWTFEASGSVFFFADNKEFWGGNKLENEPVYAIQGHVIHTFRPGLWLSLSTAYGWGYNPKLNGDPIDNPKGNWLSALSLGVPLSRTQGIKISWLHGRTQEPTGADFQNFSLGWSVMF